MLLKNQSKAVKPIRRSHMKTLFGAVVMLLGIAMALPAFAQDSVTGPNPTPSIPVQETVTSPDPTPSFSVAGTCYGEWRGVGFTGSLTFYLKQDGEKVWGTLDSPNSRPARYDVKIEGALKGDQLSMIIPEAAHSYIKATVRQTKKGAVEMVAGKLLGFSNVAVDFDCTVTPPKKKK